MGLRGTVKANLEACRRPQFWRVCTASRGKCVPLGHSGRAIGLVSPTIDEVALCVKMGVDAGMDGGELLKGFELPVAKHRPLSSPERQMGVLGPVVKPVTHDVPVKITQLAHRRRVGFGVLVTVLQKVPLREWQNSPVF